MTIRQLIDALNALVADPTSGVTMETPVYNEHLDGGISEPTEQVYVYPHGGPRRDQTIAMISAVTPEELGETPSPFRHEPPRTT